jgi:integrase
MIIPSTAAERRLEKGGAMYKRGMVWYAKFPIPRSRPVCRALGKSKTLAKMQEAAILKEIAEGTFFDKQIGEYLTVCGLLDLYVEKHSLKAKKPETVKNESFLIRQLNKKFGDELIITVGPLELECYMADREKEGVGDVTIHHELALLRHAYSLAVKRWDLLEKTPFDKVKLPCGDNRRVRYLKPDEEERLVARLKNHPWLFSAVLIARDTGFRRINLCELEWSQIYFKERLIKIGKTKNGEPNYQPMTDGVYRELLKIWGTPNRHPDYVFFLKSRPKIVRPLKRGTVSQAFKRVVREAGIEDFRWHDLRHDFCSKLFQGGETLGNVAELAGHKDLDTTRRYSHMNVETKRKVIAKLKPFGFKSASKG